MIMPAPQSATSALRVMPQSEAFAARPVFGTAPRTGIQSSTS
jgi:hypothetical protein